jgi:hypothetical protein
MLNLTFMALKKQFVPTKVQLLILLLSKKIVDSIRPGLITHMQFFKAQSIEKSRLPPIPSSHQRTNFFQRGLVESLKGELIRQ